MSSSEADNRLTDCANGPSGGSAAASISSSGRGTQASSRSTTTTSSKTRTSSSSCGPGFTAENEVRERASLTPFEWIEAECDLRGISPREAVSYSFTAGNEGTSSSNVENGQNESTRWEHDAVIREAIAKVTSRRRKHKADQMGESTCGDEEASSDNLLRHLDQELRSIPDEEKDSYLQAVKRRCPDALPNDPSGRSRRIGMIRHCANDTRLAAERIVEYWEERRRTFGEDRCYLPMALHGTMKDQVSSMIEQPTHHILSGRDAAGRMVLVFEFSPSTLEVEVPATESNKMERWYMLECLCDYRSPTCNQSEGTVFIMNCQGVAEASFHPLAVINQALLMLEVFPITLRAIHIVRPSDFTLREVLPVMKLDIGKKLRHRLIVHGGVHVDDEEILGSLEEYGLPKVMMRAMVEGRQPNRKDWIHHRLALEYAGFFACRVNLQMEGKIPFGADYCSISAYLDSTADTSVVGPVGGGLGRDPPSSRSKDSDFALRLVDYTRCRSGRSGDERMSQAIKAKIQNPSLSSYDALVAGGFVYPAIRKGVKASEIYDNENISLQQRMNQLSRRLRRVRNTVASRDSPLK